MQQYRNDLTARSLVASLLLGMRRPELTGRRLVAAGRVFGFSDGAVRVALSRMAAAGELEVEAGSYRLAGPLLDRHQRQEEGRRPALREWDRTWRMGVVGGAGRRAAADRADLRRRLIGARLAEWREGVWIRPDNLADPPDDADCAWFVGARACSPIEAGELWDLAGWATGAEELLAAMGDAAVDMPAEFRTAAAVVRHLRDDPLLPPVLLPPDWPGDRLRAAYDRYEAGFQARLRPLLTG